MTQASTDKIKTKLLETREKIDRTAKAKVAAEQKLAALRQDERALVTTLVLIGEEIPAPVATATPLTYGTVRGIDAAIQVTTEGEEVSTDEVWARIQAAGLNFVSKNPPNALHTAMSRAPDAFERIAGTRLFRRKRLGKDTDAPPNGEGFRSNGASMHGGLNAN